MCMPSGAKKKAPDTQNATDRRKEERPNITKNLHGANFQPGPKGREGGSGLGRVTRVTVGRDIHQPKFSSLSLLFPLLLPPPLLSLPSLPTTHPPTHRGRQQAGPTSCPWSLCATLKTRGPHILTWPTTEHPVSQRGPPAAPR